MAKKGGGAFGGNLLEAPDSNVVPEGMYLTKVVKIVEKHSKGGKLMMSGQFQILEPKALKGQMIFENYTLGSDDDPEAEQAATFKTSIGARNYKSLLKKANVPIEKTDSSDDVANKAAGNEVLLSVQQIEEAEGPYKGTLRNRISAYYEPGEREPAVTGEGGKKSSTTSAAPPKAAKPKPAKPEPEEEEDDDDDDDDDDEDDED